MTNNSFTNKHISFIQIPEIYVWDDWDISYVYKDEEDPVFKSTNTQKSTQTPPSINVRKYSSCINPERFKIIKHLTTNRQNVKQYTNVSTQTTPQTSTSSTQTIPSVSNSSTQTLNHSTSVSTQTEPQNENKFSLFRFLLFLIHQI